MVYVPLALVVAILYPVGAGFDEAAHIARVQQLASGELVAQEVNPEDVEYWWYSGASGSSDALYGGKVDRALLEAAFNGNDHFLYNFGSSCEFPPWESPELALDVSYGQETDVLPFSNTAIYSVFSYLPQTIGFLIASLFTKNAYLLIIVMRLTQTIVLAAAFFLAIRVIPIGKWLLACVCVMSVTIFLNSGVSADVVCVACCFVFLAVLLKFLLERDVQKRFWWVVLFLVVVLMGQIKISYLPLMLLVMLIPAVRNEYRNKRFFLVVGCAVVISLVAFFVWYVVGISGVNTGAMFRNDVYPDEQIAYIFQNPVSFLRTLAKELLTIGVFSFSSYGTLPTHQAPIYHPSWLSIVLLFVAILLRDSREEDVDMSVCKVTAVSLAFAATVLTVFVLVVVALYLQFTPVGMDSIQGVQPRYFLPVLPFVLIAILLPSRLGVKCYTDEQMASQRVGAACASGLMIVIATIIFCNFLSAVF